MKIVSLDLNRYSLKILSLNWNWYGNSLKITSLNGYRCSLKIISLNLYFKRSFTRNTLLKSKQIVLMKMIWTLKMPLMVYFLNSLYW